MFGFRFFRTLGAFFAVLAGFRGTNVEVENSDTHVSVKLH